MKRIIFLSDGVYFDDRISKLWAGLLGQFTSAANLVLMKFFFSHKYFD